ncbi:MAG: DnaJ domain-containing protein, partial [Nitrospinaceae bacterium]|nr:DnaJ domain-containing protein [Nitrospinaceae bacterium]NIR57011.1 DnaJ domain-containing protein [Nitrospinaceae bacterium]NIS85936.1 DnaJ domain-containing protein [Nitrospinaceae bacterium]NIT84317.1 DnaJ domain-containing protein [Nitrospinaceae bacterium]NIU46507.1 DnaJ domain-containing protein [Nitrospinaceae bacterium]
MDHLFKILKVAPTASLDEVKRAYRERVKFWHPDRFPAESDRLQKLAHRQMQAINRAYKELEQHLADRRAASPRTPGISSLSDPLPTLQFQNGDCYIGPLAGSVPHGLGTYLFAEGNRYIGE